MRASLTQLSRREQVMLALAVVLLLAAGGLRYLTVQAQGTQDDLATAVRNARAALDRAHREADLTPLRQQKQTLEQQVQDAQQSADIQGSQVPLALLDWADSADAKTRALNHASDQVEAGGTPLVAHRYALELVGEPEGLRRFMALATMSDYHPRVEEMALAPEEGSGWRMSVTLLVYTRKEAVQ